MKHSFSFLLIVAILVASFPVHAEMTDYSTKENKNSTAKKVLFDSQASGHMALTAKDSISADEKSNTPFVIRKLPPPERAGKGLSVLQALDKRKTNRLIKDEVLSDQELSNVLWAAWGMAGNQKKHTTPTYMGATIDIYVALPDGLWLYRPCSNHLEQVLTEPLTKKYELFATELFYAIPPDNMSYILLGSVCQNVVLYCSSRGLYNALRVSRALLLEEKFPLAKGFKLIASQGVGWPR